jgi:hypothetical protein
MQYIAKEGSGARYRGSDVSGRIIQLDGDSATFDFAPYRARTRITTSSAIRATRSSSFVTVAGRSSGMTTVSGPVLPAPSMISAGTTPCSPS